jgi:phosphatidylglycerol:prolipoprotein diacylglycerol transferase
MHPYLHIFNRTLPSYGTLAVAGLILSILVGSIYAKIYRIERRDILYASCYGGLGMILGAKILYFVPFIPDVLRNIAQGEQIDFEQIFAGYVFYGGFLGLVAGIWFYTKMMKLPFLNFLNVLAIVVPLFHGIGRIGCFLAGCCYGEIGVLPVQLVESGANLCLFAFLAVYGRKRRTPGQLMGIYLVVYPAVRIVTEIFREDSIRGLLHFGRISVSTSQIISLILFPIGILLLKKAKKENK